MCMCAECAPTVWEKLQVLAKLWPPARRSCTRPVILNPYVSRRIYLGCLQLVHLLPQSLLGSLGLLYLISLCS
jgi:hypothetical protein